MPQLGNKTLTTEYSLAYCVRSAAAMHLSGGVVIEMTAKTRKGPFLNEAAAAPQDVSIHSTLTLLRDDGHD
ncbi:hypothetical protein BDW02DRAFT_573301 [Decorospora gaudefroyi]|uniref:Uncharacterized protein n=1 Tax=Decorospora gaudefroyi TaxID=184978 RepID=A0A6A5K1L7_9PLEO|nr:hypothetical protein BDW02DRAFT_573301 [Decorospora gaudefroyi]